MVLARRIIPLHRPPFLPLRCRQQSSGSRVVSPGGQSSPILIESHGSPPRLRKRSFTRSIAKRAQKPNFPSIKRQIRVWNFVKGSFISSFRSPFVMSGSFSTFHLCISALEGIQKTRQAIFRHTGLQNLHIWLRHGSQYYGVPQERQGQGPKPFCAPFTPFCWWSWC